MNFIHSLSLPKLAPIFQIEKSGWLKYFLLLIGFCLALLVLKFKFIAIAIVAGLIGSIILLFNPEAALLVNINLGQLYIQHGFSMAALLLSMVSWILYMVLKKPKIFISFQSKLVFIFGIWLLLTIPFSSGGLLYGLRYSVRLLIPVILFFSITTILKTEKQLLRFILFLILTGLGLSIFGNIQYFFQVPIFSHIITDRGSIILPLGPFGDPVAYGAQLLAILGLSFAKFLSEPRGKRKTIFFFIFLAVTSSLIASLNRGAIIGFVASALVMLFLNRKGGIRLILFSIVALIILSQVGFNQLISNKIETIFTETKYKSGHFGKRYEASLAGLDALREKPQLLILGSGVFTYMDTVLPYLSTGSVKHSGNTNAFILFLVELGIFGFGIFVWIIGLALKNLYFLQRSFKLPGDLPKASLCQGLFASLVGLLVMSIVNTIWDMTLFWVILTLPVVIKVLGDTPKEGPNQQFLLRQNGNV